MPPELYLSTENDIFFNEDFLRYKKYKGIIEHFNTKRIIFYSNTNSIFCIGLKYFRKFQIKCLFKKHGLIIEDIQPKHIPDGLYYMNLIKTEVTGYSIKLKDPENLYFKLLSMPTGLLQLQ